MKSYNNKVLKEYWQRISKLSGDEISVFLDQQFKSRRVAEKNFKNRYYLILILGFLFYLINIGEINHISFLEININDKYVIMMLICTIMSFCYYSGVINYKLEDEHFKALQAYAEQNLDTKKNKDFISIFISRDFVNYERTIEDGLLNKAMTYGLGFLFLIGPLVAIGLCLFVTFRNWTVIDYHIFKVLNISISVLLLFRGLTVALTGYRD